MGVLRHYAAKKAIAPLLARQQQQMQRVAAAGAASGLLALGFYSASDVQSKFDLASATGPLVRLLDAETSHRVGILAAKLGFFPRETRADPESLRVDLWGKQFRNPLGEARPAARL
jgi:dihydroorotate dehydrogenase